MPVLDVTNFVSWREKNRGFVVLSFLSQTYLYGGLHDDARTVNSFIYEVLIVSNH